MRQFPGWLHVGLRRWLVPIVLGLALVLLLLVANPVADRWVSQTIDVDLNFFARSRVGFWLGLSPYVWTALRLKAMRERLGAAPPASRMGPAREGQINPA